MNMGTISYWFYEAFESMKKNIKNVLISISTMIATMLIIAIGYAVLQNSSYIIKQKQEANSKIVAYLKTDITDEQINVIHTRLDDMDGVINVQYYSTQDGIDSMPQKEMFTRGIEEKDLKEIFPAKFVVTFSSLESEKEIMSALRGMEGVREGTEDVTVTDSAERSIKEAKSATVISVTAMILIVELSIFLMINTTKLMLYARRKEISIMKYVGAKDGFIKMPFAIEGVIMSLIAVIIVVIIFSFAYEPIVTTMSVRASYQYLTLKDFMPDLRNMLIVIAIIIGAVGSTASMNKYLDV